MSEPFMGATVLYCGHRGTFVADIWKVAGANVVRANGPVTPGNIDRRNVWEATHHLSDHLHGFWRPDLGVFVMPEEAVREIERTKLKPKLKI